jgi:hypothetical protein
MISAAASLPNLASVVLLQILKDFAIRVRDHRLDASEPALPTLYDRHRSLAIEEAS